MGNKKSKSMQPVVEEEEKRPENLVQIDDYFFSQELVTKIPNELEKIRTWRNDKKELWFYDRTDDDYYATPTWESGYIEEFDEEKLVVTILVGFTLYEQALWKVFTKYTPGAPDAKMWEARLKKVGLGTIKMDIGTRYNLKF